MPGGPGTDGTGRRAGDRDARAVPGDNRHPSPPEAVNAGLCLYAYGAATSDGTALVLWSCNGGGNQKRTLT